MVAHTMSMGADLYIRFSVFPDEKFFQQGRSLAASDE